ncbi:TIR domain-containing protein [Celeribacter sp.]|uniref:TIR domain-containing protein n=1 Tax=Celeribacter sp. TaxID=1890673 RepID=UPI003A90BCFF
MTGGMTAFKESSFSVGLSFAGEQRDYVEEVALALRARNVNVFYDAFHEADLWGCNLVDTLDDLYSERMKAVIIFVSKEYVEKAFTSVERQAAQSKAISAKNKYIYPVRFHDVKLPGMPSTISYLEAARNTPEQLAAKICKVIGATLTHKDNDVTPPRSKTESGRFSFSQEDYDGRAEIGEDIWRFEIQTSPASGSSVYFYNDPETIRGIAVAEGATDFDDVKDATSYNFTSSSRTVSEGQILIMKNTAGFFAALKVIEVQDRSRGAETDTITVDYVILKEGGTSFSEVLP